MEKAYLMRSEKSAGETAVDGLIAGLGAGIVMAGFLLIVGFFSGDTPAAILKRFDTVQADSWIVGLLSHLAVSAIYGIIFGLLSMVLLRIRPSLVRFSWLIGLFYGLVLYAIAQSAFFAGIDSGLQQFSAVIFLLAHVVYGFVLGFVFGRQ